MSQRSIGAAPARLPALFVASDFCRQPGFGRHHPLSIPRVSAVLEVCESLGWLDARCTRASRVATIPELTAYHDAGYVEALRASDAAGCVAAAVRERHGFGTFENPLFPGVFERAATAVGGSLLAAELALEGRAVFHPAGGTHHGRRDRASGFCYFNDPVFAVRRLLERGIERVLYVDLDAHHGDGVQDAFGPEAVVVTCGTDALAGDPLSGMALGNVALWDAVERVIGARGPAVVLGGGGYNPWTLARCWTGLWGRLSGRAIPVVLPAPAQLILRSLECALVDDEDVDPSWFATLADAPRPGEVRAEVKSLASLGRTLHGLA